MNTKKQLWRLSLYRGASSDKIGRNWSKVTLCDTLSPMYVCKHGILTKYKLERCRVTDYNHKTIHQLITILVGTSVHVFVCMHVCLFDDQ